MTPQALLLLTPMQQSEVQKLCHAVPATHKQVLLGSFSTDVIWNRPQQARSVLNPSYQDPGLKNGLFTGDSPEGLCFHMSAESCMQDTYLSLVEYSATENGCPKCNSFLLQPESVPAPDPVGFLLPPCLRNFSDFCWVLRTNQTKTTQQRAGKISHLRQGLERQHYCNSFQCQEPTQ